MLRTVIDIMIIFQDCIMDLASENWQTNMIITSAEGTWACLIQQLAVNIKAF
jgi:hypothetical protein